MNSELLINELGHTLGFTLQFSENGTCGVFFDEDEIIFEKHESQLYLIADLGPAHGRTDTYKSLLEANYLGQASGQAVLALDSVREEFTLHRILDGEMDYNEFESILTVFVSAVRYWKKWLKEGSSTTTTDTTEFVENTAVLA